MKISFNTFCKLINNCSTFLIEPKNNCFYSCVDSRITTYNKNKSVNTLELFYTDSYKKKKYAKILITNKSKISIDKISNQIEIDGKYNLIPMQEICLKTSNLNKNIKYTNNFRRYWSVD